MKIENIFAKNIELTPAIEERVRTRVIKLAKLTKRLEPVSIKVEVGKPSQHHNKGDDVFYAEFSVSVAGMDFYSSKSEPDLYKAIEKVRDDMVRQIVTWKRKEQSQQRRGGSMLKRLMRFGREE